MADVTRNDIIDEVLEKLKPIKKNDNERGKMFFNNFAVITSLSVIFLSILLFEYNTGYCEVFNLPAECMAIDMKMLIPFAAQIGTAVVCFLFYLSSIRANNALGRYRFSITRILWAELCLIYFLNKNQLKNFFGSWGCLLLSFAVPFLLELMFYLRNKPGRNSVIAEKDREEVLENTLTEAIFHNYYIKRGIVFFVLPLVFASSIGSLTARSNHYYRTFSYDDMQYAVIAEYADEVIAQPVKIDGKTLTIDTSEYRYISKVSLVFSYRKYENVTIRNEDDDIGTVPEETGINASAESNEPTDTSINEPLANSTNPTEVTELETN